MPINLTNAATQARPWTFKLLSLQMTVVATTLGTIGFLATVTAQQAEALRGPVPLGGFRMTQIAWAISAVAMLAYPLAGRVVLGAARKRMAARSSESSLGHGGTLLALYTTKTSLSVVFLNAIVGACGAAYLVEHDAACLGAATAAAFLSLCHFPRSNRVTAWIERHLRLIDEERLAISLTRAA